MLTTPASGALVRHCETRSGGGGVVEMVVLIGHMLEELWMEVPNMDRDAQVPLPM